MKYKPVKKDADIGPETALVQASFALDAAGSLAQETEDVEGMLAVAAGWLTFARSIERADTEKQPTGTNFITGFQGHSQTSITQGEANA